jgi:hypothetical protein
VIDPETASPRSCRCAFASPTLSSGVSEFASSTSWRWPSPVFIAVELYPGIAPSWPSRTPQRLGEVCTPRPQPSLIVCISRGRRRRARPTPGTPTSTTRAIAWRRPAAVASPREGAAAAAGAVAARKTSSRSSTTASRSSRCGRAGRSRWNLTGIEVVRCVRRGVPPAERKLSSIESDGGGHRLPRYPCNGGLGGVKDGRHDGGDR